MEQSSVATELVIWEGPGDYVRIANHNRRAWWRGEWWKAKAVDHFPQNRRFASREEAEQIGFLRGSRWYRKFWQQANERKSE